MNIDVKLLNSTLNNDMPESSSTAMQGTRMAQLAGANQSRTHLRNNQHKGQNHNHLSRGKRAMGKFNLLSR